MPPQNTPDAQNAPQALKVGDRAPAFALLDPSGAVVSSAALLEKGPLVTTFYRGVWCPYCQTDLKALTALDTEARSCGASLVAIAHQTVADSHGKYQRENQISFPILDDRDGSAAVAFGIRWSPDQLHAMQEQQMILTGLNAEPSRLLPMQARYVIGPDGIIVYADINSDYRQRPEPSEILPVLRRLQAGARP